MKQFNPTLVLVCSQITFPVKLLVEEKVSTGPGASCRWAGPGRWSLEQVWEVELSISSYLLRKQT